MVAIATGECKNYDNGILGSEKIAATVAFMEYEKFDTTFESNCQTYHGGDPIISRLFVCFFLHDFFDWLVVLCSDSLAFHLLYTLLILLFIFILISTHHLCCSAHDSEA
jgi:hypothetical protein